MYQEGEGVSFDYEQAMAWNMKAASAGNARGQYNIGFLYFSGWGVRKNYKQAMDWCLKAANNGNIDAMIQIASMYGYGQGVTENIYTVIEWYTKAANQGNATAQSNLGYIYQYQDEVKDLQKAVHWYQKAADNDYYGAKDRVKQLNEQGYYAKEDEQEGILNTCIYFMMIIIKTSNIQVEEKTKNENIQGGDAINNTINDQNQYFTTTDNNDEYFNKMFESKMKDMEETFQSKINLIQQQNEGNNDSLQKELDILKQEKLQKNEENKALKEILARSQPEMEDTISNDLNYDTVCTLSKKMMMILMLLPS
jgi:TPR repeat protein